MNFSVYVDALKANSLSNTRSRQKVFNVLASNQRPLSMNELIRECVPVNRVSIYRIIEIFEGIGIVNRINFGWKYKIELSDNFKDHHHHLSCINCGTMIDFKEPKSLDQELNDISVKYNFKLQQHTLELRGICSNCN